MIKATGDFRIKFKNSVTIYENIIKCRVKEREFNLTMNNSVLSDKFNGIIDEMFVNEEFEPYVTSIGLYNDKKELLMICKPQQPITLPKTTDMVFEIRFDG